ncbi:MAG TPA: hypothetical protein VJ983_04375 [candidate division Zixibacteria bacterium]|nr:hypothetical protein [candidate division Zixibacteria bacterium]
MESQSAQKSYSGERLVWIFLVLVLLVSAAFFFIKAYRLQQQVYDTSKQLLDLDNKLSEQQQTIASLSQVIRNDSGKTVQLVPVFTSSELTDLSAKGIKDPYSEISADLLKHPEVIPPSSKAGGAFTFGSPTRICLLGPDRVWAYVDNGRVGRAILFRYEVADDGSIVWKALESTSEARK